MQKNLETKQASSTVLHLTCEGVLGMSLNHSELPEATRSATTTDEGWIHLIQLARDWGFTKEEVRIFIEICLSYPTNDPV